MTFRIETSQMKQPKVWAFVQIGKLEGQIWSTGIFDDTCAHEFVKVGAGKSSRLLIGLPCLRVRRFQGCVECQPTRPASGWNTGKKNHTGLLCHSLAHPHGLGSSKLLVCRSGSPRNTTAHNLTHSGFSLRLP